MHTIGSREFWVPGRRQALIFLLLVLLGLGAWAFTVAARLYFDPPGVLDEAFDSGMVLPPLLALAAGFAAPRGFYLWGLAVVSAHPVADLVLTSYRQGQGADIVLGGAQGWVGLAFVLVLAAFTTVTLATVLSTTGAGLRLLLGYRRRARPGTPRDVRAH